MLMDATPLERLEFIAAIMQDVEPAYRVTQEGDPDRFAMLPWLETCFEQYLLARERGDDYRPVTQRP